MVINFYPYSDLRAKVPYGVLSSADHTVLSHIQLHSSAPYFKCLNSQNPNLQKTCKWKNRALYFKSDSQDRSQHNSKPLWHWQTLGILTALTNKSHFISLNKHRQVYKAHSNSALLSIVQLSLRYTESMSTMECEMAKTNLPLNSLAAQNKAFSNIISGSFRELQGENNF